MTHIYKRILITILKFLPFFLFKTAYSQSNDFNYLGNKIKTTYAGYRDKTNNKTFDIIINEVKKDNSKDTFALLSKLTTFFKDLHLVLYDFNSNKKIDSETCKINLRTSLSYLHNPKILKDNYEGYWLSELGNCVIGLIKVSTLPLIYKGYIVETITKAPKGFCILEMTKGKDNYFNTDYKEENLAYRIFLRSKFKNDNILLVNSYGKWQKIKNYTPGFLNTITEFSFTPSFKIIDKNTALLSMPDFGAYNVKPTDSIIKANDSIISHISTLIIDIRNNMGGTIKNYLSLLPYIYTNPILHCGGKELCSESLIEDLKQDIKNYYSSGDTTKAKKAEKKLDTLLICKGGFLPFPKDTLAKQLETKIYPQNIAVIINNICLSAAELMILDFKQSKKVKFFGEKTGGAVDYLDAIILTLPISKYSLFVATSKRNISLGQPKYDNIGIKPDIEIPNTIKDWVEFVKSYYE
jgi:hypothetical protein